MYTLSRWAPQDRSGKVCWLLNELNVPFETLDLEHGKHHDDPEYRKMHPLGQTPALRDLRRDVTLFESGAICLYLADQHPERNLMPENTKAQCYQWILYNYATLEPAITPYWEIDPKDPELQRKKVALDKAVVTLLRPVEAALERTAFVAGDQFSVADVPIGQSIFWLRNRPIFSEFPRITAYVEKLKSREAARKSGLFAEASN